MRSTFTGFDGSWAALWFNPPDITMAITLRAGIENRPGPRMAPLYRKSSTHGTGKWKYTVPIERARDDVLANGPTVEEKRKDARYACSLKVGYKLDEDQALTRDTVGLNISERGMLLRPSGGLLEHQQIRIRFTLPDKAEIRNARAVVLRQEARDCVAVMFISVLPNVQECFE
jgi:hypothetical protein